MYKDKKEQLDYQRNWVARRRKAYIKKRGGRCLHCGSKKDLEFHHRNRKTKVSHAVWSWSTERANKELKKCDLLCRSCHHKETSKERNYYQAPHGSLTSYKNYGCRCKDCRAANAKYENSRRKERT